MLKKGSLVILILPFLVNYSKAATVIPAFLDSREAYTLSTEKIETTTASQVHQSDVEERVDILHSSEYFKEIDQDVLQLVASNPSNVRLSCRYSKDLLHGNITPAYWKYHGIGEIPFDFDPDNSVHMNLTSAPPVIRMECILLTNESVRNNTFIYSGNGKPPFLDNHGKSVKAIVLNETTAHLPCLLNYPIDNSDHYELQLFKDGEMVENKNNCLSYTPELGYFLNLTLLENPKGRYECKVLNSTDDDKVVLELRDGNFIRVLYKDGLTSFHVGAPRKHRFHCLLPKPMFQEKFEWFYLLKNGTYKEIMDLEKDQNNTIKDPSSYSDCVLVPFPNISIAGITCSGFLKNSAIAYNNSIPVNIISPYEPRILNDPSEPPVIYQEGKNLTCAAYADPVVWRWYKNGEPVVDLNTRQDVGQHVQRSTLVLNPSVNDVDSNYTCVVSNFLGEANHSFRVQLPSSDFALAPTGLPTGWLATIIIAALLVLILIGLLFAVFRVSLTRRKFDRQQVINFFQGFGKSEPQYDELEPYASVAYDDTREIKYKSLIFERELKPGNFGKVVSGRLVDKKNGTSIPVAIKSIKDDSTRTEQEIDDAFNSFLYEIKIMQFIGDHKNVVGYVGAVTSDIENYSAYLVVEYCSGGDLGTYLLENRESFHDDILGLHHNVQSVNYTNVADGSNTALRTSYLMKWAEDIAAGLEYISSRNIVHNDLAARNVLLANRGINSEDHPIDPSKLFAKITDFGISRNLNYLQKDYYQILLNKEDTKKRVLPLRWMSIEALESLRFTTQSDIWSLAVTFWEMFTLGDIPYRDLNENSGNLDPRIPFISYLKQGNTLSEPYYAPREICELMSQCWEPNPNDRPTLRFIRESLHSMNERIRSELLEQSQDSSRSSSDTAQPTYPSYSTVGYVQNLAYSPTEVLECSMEYREGDEDVGDEDRP